MFLKTCLVFVQPLGVIWLLLTGWLIMIIWRRNWQASALPALAWAILTIVTCTPLSSWLLAFWENDYPVPKIETVPAADVILCLGGGAEPSLTEITGVHFSRASDRISTAVMLANQKKGTVLVVGGGVYKDGDAELSEADATVAYLQRQRVTDLRIVSLGACADTHDEALKMVDLAKQHDWDTVVLVTSASHMSRAAATFTKAGLKVIPVPCNYVSSFNRVGHINYLHPPSAGGFESFSIMFHELIGSWVYRSRGWID